MNKFFSTVTVLTGLLVGSIALADCPDKYTTDRDQLVDDIASAETCYEASNLAESCAWGSTADLATTSAAISVCARAYEEKISRPDNAMLMALFEKCDAKYEGQDGTLYRSMNGFCRLEVSKLFSNLYTPVDGVEN